MSILPDELWTKILELGTSTSQLTYRDLCSISIACRRLHRLSDDPSLWSTLLSLDFPNPSSSSSEPPSKALFKLRFERDKAPRHAVWRREVLIAESNVAVCTKRLGELEGLILKESERLKAARLELNNLERARQVSVALNIWQPEVVRGRQKQIVEQCTVPIESRLSSVNMEIRVCKQQLTIYNKAYNDQKEKLKEGEEALKSLKYHPLQSYQSGATAKDCNRKQKKLKQISKYVELALSSSGKEFLGFTSTRSKTVGGVSAHMKKHRKMKRHCLHHISQDPSKINMSCLSACVIDARSKVQMASRHIS